MAEDSQEMFLKVILDRLEFVSKFVELSAESHTRTSTFYLLLPVILKEYAMNIEWKTAEQEKARRVQEGDIGAHSAGPSKAPSVELGEVSSNGRLQAGSLSYKEEDRYICGLCAAVWFVSSRT